ncbi:hypothetical protein CTEN210_13339 [Chaetoceros tenuissimus]|uniref:Uncharacterized protein n=1 Tax=Chaetoceros tenuissimus TaxID=426638 RepID=A0AAD3D367_9STRA|nr:hypothetical protein CTEN210_13339 [Chaetoceros tenuissimus]
MQIPKSIILSFALQASFVDARRSSSKSSQSAKQPKSVCLEQGSLYEIEPRFEGIASPQNVYEKCCEEWDEFETNPWSADPTIDVISFGACASDLGQTFLECVGEYTYSSPFRHYYNVELGDNEFQFITTNDALLGDTAFRGAIGVDTGDEKVILQYESTPLYDEDENSLAGRSLADLEYIEYSFKALACHGTETECPEQFYLNVYSKADPPRSAGWYDCAFDFTPTEGGVENGDWTTIRFTRDSVPGNTRCGSGGAANACSDCPVGTSWGTVADLNEGYEMGASTNQILIFALNMGDTSTSAAGLDTGLEGLYDRVVIKLHGEEARVYDL